jgi:hypothetical protein
MGGIGRSPLQTASPDRRDHLAPFLGRPWAVLQVVGNRSFAATQIARATQQPI